MALVNTPWDTIANAAMGVIRMVVPDKTAQAAASAALEQLRETDEAKKLEDDVRVQLAGLDNVKAEAQGQSWLQRNWRPITALTFVGLVTAYWFGFSAPNLPAASIDNLFGLVKICLGGYTVGRTCEKIALPIAAVFKK